MGQRAQRFVHELLIRDASESLRDQRSVTPRGEAGAPDQPAGYPVLELPGFFQVLDESRQPGELASIRLAGSWRRQRDKVRPKLGRSSCHRHVVSDGHDERLAERLVVQARLSVAVEQASGGLHVVVGRVTKDKTEPCYASVIYFRLSNASKTSAATANWRSLDMGSWCVRTWISTGSRSPEAGVARPGEPSDER